MKLLILVCTVLTVYIGPNNVEAARSAPDLGLCKVVHDGKIKTIDCLSGTAVFCCQTDKAKLWNNVTMWSNRCCTESEFVLQNA